MSCPSVCVCGNRAGRSFCLVSALSSIQRQRLSAFQAATVAATGQTPYTNCQFCTYIEFISASFHQATCLPPAMCFELWLPVTSGRSGQERDNGSRVLPTFRLQEFHVLSCLWHRWLRHRAPRTFQPGCSEGKGGPAQPLCMPWYHYLEKREGFALLWNLQQCGLYPKQETLPCKNNSGFVSSITRRRH